MNLLSSSLSLSLGIHLSPLSPLSVSNPSSLSCAYPLYSLISVLFLTVLNFFSILCFLSVFRHGWQRSMSTPSRTWSSCCWATRWDLVANTGGWMDRWTHRGREGGIVEGGMVGAGEWGWVLDASESREGDELYLYCWLVLEMSHMGGL